LPRTSSGHSKSIHRPSTRGDSYRGRWDRLTGLLPSPSVLVAVEVEADIVFSLVMDTLESEDAENARRLGIRRILWFREV
jgi:hypothetical protein